MKGGSGGVVARGILQSSRYLLLDFDGPICDIFAGFPAESIAAILRRTLEGAGVQLPASVQKMDDPLEIFRFSAGLGRDLNYTILNALTDLEVEAVMTARPSPGGVDVMRWAREAGKSVAVVSNNSVAAVMAYLQEHELLALIDHVSARAAADPSLMKPSPYLIRQALALLDAGTSQCALVGDSVSDVQAAKACAITVIGYANRPGKDRLLLAAGANAIITSMTELVADAKKREG